MRINFGEAESQLLTGPYALPNSNAKMFPEIRCQRISATFYCFKLTHFKRIGYKFNDL